MNRKENEDNKNISLSKYKVLAQVFEELEQYELSAYFYQIVNNEVESHIFDKVRDFKGSAANFLGIKIIRKRPFQERLFFSVLNGSKKTIEIGLKFIFCPVILISEGFSHSRNNHRLQSSTYSSKEILPIRFLGFSLACFAGVIMLSILIVKPDLWKAIFPPKISQSEVVKSISKFPVSKGTISRVEEWLKEKGYNLPSPLVQTIITNNICLAYISEKPRKETQYYQISEKQKNRDCVDIEWLNKTTEQIENESNGKKRDELILWAKKIYQYESHFRLPLDGIIEVDDQNVIQNQALNIIDANFNTKTKLSIQKLANDIHIESNSVPSNGIARVPLAYTQEILKDLLNSTSYGGGVIEGEVTPSNKIRKLQSQWISGIYDFQKKHLSDHSGISYGIIYDSEDATYDRLITEAKKELKLTKIIDVARDKFYSQTAQGINKIEDTIYSEIINYSTSTNQAKLKNILKKEYGIDLSASNPSKDELLAKIKETLFKHLSGQEYKKAPYKNSLNTSFFLEDDWHQKQQSDRDQWIQLIFLYQKYRLKFQKPDGIMSLGGDTMNKLVERIVKDLGKSLTEDTT